MIGTLRSVKLGNARPYRCVRDDIGTTSAPCAFSHRSVG